MLNLSYVNTISPPSNDMVWVEDFTSEPVQEDYGLLRYALKANCYGNSLTILTPLRYNEDSWELIKIPVFLTVPSNTYPEIYQELCNENHE